MKENYNLNFGSGNHNQPHEVPEKEKAITKKSYDKKLITFKRVFKYLYITNSLFFTYVYSDQNIDIDINHWYINIILLTISITLKLISSYRNGTVRKSIEFIKHKRLFKINKQ